MAVTSVVAFWAVAALLVAVPGPDWAFVLSSGVRTQTVVPAVSGIVLGYAGITVVVAAGVGTLVARSSAALSALTIVGGLYLIWHGAKTIIRESGARRRAVTNAAGERTAGGESPPSGERPASKRGLRGGFSSWEVLARGMGVSALNPKGLLLFLALLPQFTSARWDWPLAAQLGLLGLIFITTCALFYLCLGSFARKILHARPAAARIISGASGVAMVVIGALLLIDRFVA
ncbi:MAG TPA: LysE family translocator [Streptosporangiaceae bacterium]